MDAETASAAAHREHGLRQSALQIGYLKAEKRALRSRLASKRILFTYAERRTLSILAKEIGTKAPRGLDPIVSPATLLRWHRDLVARKWTFLERRRRGRPRTCPNMEQLVLRMADENPSWGYTRIHGALCNLDIKVGRSSIRRISKITWSSRPHARGQGTPWSVFLKAHWKAIAALYR